MWLEKTPLRKNPLFLLLQGPGDPTPPAPSGDGGVDGGAYPIGVPTRRWRWEGRGGLGFAGSSRPQWISRVGEAEKLLVFAFERGDRVLLAVALVELDEAERHAGLHQGPAQPITAVLIHGGRLTVEREAQR